MKIRTISYAILWAALTTPVSADELQVRQTDHFGILKVKAGSEFHLAAMCTVSGGSSAKRATELATLVDFIPHVGDVLAEGMRAAPLKKGEALCGLRHYKGPSPWTFAANTNGFNLDIRTYADGELIGGGSPTFACGKGLVNKTSVCFEEIGLKDNDGKKQADAVTACIETKRPSDGTTVSIVLYAGAASDAIAAEASEEGAEQLKSCSDRTY